MSVELLATCWTHAGDAAPVSGRELKPEDLRTRAEAVAAAHTGIGFTIRDLDAAEASYGLPDVRRICDDLGLVHLEVELLESWWTTGPRRAESDRTRLSLLRAAEVLGARQIKVGPDVEVVDGAVAPLSDAAHWAGELHELAVQAADVGTRVALEPLPFSHIADFRSAAALLDAADHPAAGLAVDIWHLERGPSTLTDLTAIPGDKVFVVELDDAPAPQSADLFHDTVHHRVLCGAGTFDVAGFIETLQQIGFAGPWGVEILSETHRRRRLQDSLVDAHRSTVTLFDSVSAARAASPDGRQGEQTGARDPGRGRESADTGPGSPPVPGAATLDAGARGAAAAGRPPPGSSPRSGSARAGTPCRARSSRGLRPGAAAAPGRSARRPRRTGVRRDRTWNRSGEASRSGG